MARQKKIKTVHFEINKEEVKMSDEIVLENVQTEIDLANQELNRIKKEIEETKQKLETLPRREITQEEKNITENQITMSNERKAAKEEIERQKAYDNVKVTGKFMNLRYPGQSIKLPYIKYIDDPVKWHAFEHGKVYTIPRGFADQINGGDEKNPCYYMPKFKQKEGIMDPNAPSSQIDEVDTSNKKYAFVPINF